jgi:seryl-tRNA synthetase
MLDQNFIRRNVELVKKNTIERGKKSEIVDTYLELDVVYREGRAQLEALFQRKNEIADMMKDASKRTDELKNEAKDLKVKAEELEVKVEELEKSCMEALNRIPNMHFDDVPRGANDKENVVLKKVGDPKKFDFEPKDHLELAKIHDLLDFESGAKVSGSQFVYFKNQMVQLEFALMMFGMEFLTKKGFKLVSTPDLAKSRFYIGTGYDPKGSEAQIYEIEGEDLGLIATAEVTMAGMFADEILEEKDLPMKFAAISHCFRKEAGAYGSYSKGMYRLHQFTKLEMFAYTTPEQSLEMHQHFLAMEEEITQALGLSYQVIHMCTGDLGNMAARKYDVEVWMPGRNDYGEITSTSNCTDFQARNLNIRYRKNDGGLEFAHMLNGTALVSSRVPLALLENYQNADGSITIPEVLRKFTGFDKIEKAK